MSHVGEPTDDPRSEHRATSGASGLSHIRRIVVPRQVSSQVHDYLRARGAEGHEGVGFWAGSACGDRFDVSAALIPDQLSERSKHGLMVVVTGDALFRMNVWLHRNHLTLIAQLHSHPGAAYHSDTDDNLAVVTQVGALSIVVPDYARGPLALDAAAVYRLDASGRWKRLQTVETMALITVV